MQNKVSRWLFAPFFVFFVVGCSAKSATLYLQPVKEPGVSILSRENVSVAGAIQKGSLVSIALRYSKDPDTQETIFGVGVTAGNESNAPVNFGPDDVFLADSGLRLLPRLSEAWLENFYRTAIREAEIAASYSPPMPAFAPAYRVGITQMQIGNMSYTYGTIGPDPYAALGQNIGTLLAVMEIKELQKERQKILENLLRPTVLLPKSQLPHSSVYFYNPPTVRPRFPLKVIVRVGKDLYLFHFNQPIGEDTGK